MIARLTVVLFIFVCLEAGIVLILLPWFSDWGSNYILRLVVDSTGWSLIDHIVDSTWFKGAVTGLGVFDLFLAFWEIAHFNESVAELEAQELVEGPRPR